MNARTLLNIGLAVLIAVMAVLYFKPPPARDEAHRLLATPASEVREIEIKRANTPPMALRRDTSGWRMMAPVQARLDELTLARTLELVRVTSQSRFAASDLARYGLDKPWATVTINAESIEFGSSNELTRELYLKRGEFVYAVPARIAAAVPADPAKLIAHRLFDGSEKPRGFQLARFSVTYGESRWLLEPADPGLSQDDLIRWTDAWKYVTSIITQPLTAAPQGESIRVALEDNRVIELKVIRRTPDLVLARLDEGLEYHLPARLAESLLAPPNAARNANR